MRETWRLKRLSQFVVSGIHKGKLRWAYNHETGCWDWLMKSSVFSTNQVHRFFWEQHRGPIPAGHDLHHTCENQRCINPWHMEPLTKSAHGVVSNDTRWH